MPHLTFCTHCLYKSNGLYNGAFDNMVTGAYRQVRVSIFGMQDLYNIGHAE